LTSHPKPTDPNSNPNSNKVKKQPKPESLSHINLGKSLFTAVS
jgi:hypothetical protein